MQLKVVQKYFTLFHSKFTVFDEGDNLVYTVEPEKRAVLRYRILDRDGNVLLIAKKRYFRFRKTFEILSPNDETVLYKVRKRVRIAKRFIFQDFTSDKIWDFRGNLFAYNFTMKKNGEIAIYFDKTFFTIRDTIKADVVDQEDMPLAVAMSAIIDTWFHQKKGSR